MIDETISNGCICWYTIFMVGTIIFRDEIIGSVRYSLSLLIIFMTHPKSAKCTESTGDNNRLSQETPNLRISEVLTSKPNDSLGRSNHTMRSHRLSAKKTLRVSFHSRYSDDTNTKRYRSSDLDNSGSPKDKKCEAKSKPKEYFIPRNMVTELSFESSFHDDDNEEDFQYEYNINPSKGSSDKITFTTELANNQRRGSNNSSSRRGSLSYGKPIEQIRYRRTELGQTSPTGMNKKCVSYTVTKVANKLKAKLQIDSNKYNQCIFVRRTQSAGYSNKSISMPVSGTTQMDPKQQQHHNHQQNKQHILSSDLFAPQKRAVRRLSMNQMVAPQRQAARRLSLTQIRSINTSVSVSSSSKIQTMSKSQSCLALASVCSTFCNDRTTISTTSGTWTPIANKREQELDKSSFYGELSLDSTTVSTSRSKGSSRCSSDHTNKPPLLRSYSSSFMTPSESATSRPKSSATFVSTKSICETDREILNEIKLLVS